MERSDAHRAVPLVRHPASPALGLDAVAVEIALADDRLLLCYRITGELRRIRVPAWRGERFVDGLWRHTCCEIFMRGAGQAGYCEYNMAHSGEWAAYAFDGYRQGGTPIDARQPAISVTREPRRLELAAAIGLSGLAGLLAGTPALAVRQTAGSPPSAALNQAGPAALSVALSIVVEGDSGELAYWALRHAGDKPDFHDERGFALELPHGARGVADVPSAP